MSDIVCGLHVIVCSLIGWSLKEYIIDRVQLVEVQANLLPSRKRLDMKTASQNGATKLNVNPLAVCVGRFEKKKVSL